MSITDAVMFWIAKEIVYFLGGILFLCVLGAIILVAEIRNAMRRK